MPAYRAPHHGRFSELCQRIRDAAGVTNVNDPLKTYHKREGCIAPYGCESRQYHCTAQVCKHTGLKSYWPDDPQERY